MSLLEKFKSQIVLDLKKKLEKKNVLQVPSIDKVTVCMWIWNLSTKKGVKDFSDLEKNITQITWQKPQMIRSKMAVSNFKLRAWMPVMLRVTLRAQRAFDFIERMTVFVLPRVRDFEWVSPKKIDAEGNLSIGFREQSVFPEIHPDEIKTPQGIQVTIWTTAQNREDALELYKALGILFVKKL